ncbi:uncharacterized protein KD926_007684 [Aspergillus affinis]|uniref:uncharacterized protein n=1 Tax=Aspergillus affinis TaxID=1070780 RepID=UPI0022FE1CB6|nr:uncharacterized protein KD926_007684 [Aspergillus affinis]KAI9040742.1 hypothetical protein KD926_007684 [Aspergillus affinis]
MDCPTTRSSAASRASSVASRHSQESQDESTTEPQTPSTAVKKKPAKTTKIASKAAQPFVNNQPDPKATLTVRAFITSTRLDLIIQLKTAAEQASAERFELFQRLEASEQPEALQPQSPRVSLLDKDLYGVDKPVKNVEDNPFFSLHENLRSRSQF